MSEWKEYKLGDVASVQTGPFGSQLHQKDYVEVGKPIITVEHLGDNRITYQNLPKVSDGDKQRLNKYWLEKGDVVFSRVGSVDRRAYVTAKEDGWLFSGRCLRVRADEKLASGAFLSYYFGQESFKEYIRRIAVGATMPSINTTILSEVDILLPKYSTQQSIASILSSLDDKIELNNAINKNLEELAQALFKRWFVDFEFPFDFPSTSLRANAQVKPNENGQPYKSSGGEMVESELGMIPKGWRVGTIGDEFLINMGQSPKGETYNENGVGMIFFQGRSDFGFRFPKVRMFTTDPKKVAKQFETLISVRAPVGDINMAQTECCIGRGLGAISHNEKLFSYTYYKVLSIQDELKSYDNEGTVFGSINKDTLGKIKTVIPPVPIPQSFNSIVSYLDELIFTSTQEISNLIQLRDSLLPKLISGELEVNQALSETEKAL